LHVLLVITERDVVRHGERGAKRETLSKDDEQ
jgi:hypothetical protein